MTVLASWWLSVTFLSCVAVGVATKIAVWGARAQTDADAVALAYATSGPVAARRFGAQLGARIESVDVRGNEVFVVVEGRWGTAVATAQSSG